MTRKSFRFASILVLSVVLAIEPRLSFAIDYHIGTGQQYATLEAFRLARVAQGASTGANSHLMDGDRLILHSNDHSLTQQLYVGYDSSVTVLSSDPNQPRDISPADNARTRLFYLDGSGSHWSKIYFESINSISGGYSSYDGGAIYAWWHNDIYSLDGHGVTFKDNFANGVGGAIYYWDALNCDLTDSSFIDNKATGRGGALYINASGILILSDTTNVTIGASAGKTSVFSGNRDQVQRDGQGNYIVGSGTANSIDFTGASGNHVNLYIKTAEGGLLNMQDPFRTNIPAYGQYTVNIEKSGIGTWGLGGISNVNGSSATTISIREGIFELYKDAALNANGTNDSITINEGASVLLRGNNTLTGTRVLFEPGAFLSFDLSYYFPTAGAAQNKNTPMLLLSGNTLQVTGTRIDANGLPIDINRNGNYILIQGTSALEIGDFNLFIGGANIDVSGRVSDRFGYSLGYGEDALGKVIDTQLVLSIKNTDNTVLRWNSPAPSDQWSVIGKNWTLIRNGEIDSFVPGDTVQFFDSGTHTINLLEDVTIGPDRDINKKPTYIDNTGMHVSGNGNWTFNGDGSITDSTLTGPAALFFDGTGTLTLANNKANTYSGGTNLAGTGTMKVSRGDQLGLGSVNFLDNGTDQTNKLHFTGTSTLGQQLVAKSGGDGLVTVDSTKNLTIQRISDNTESQGGAAHVKNGGKLTIQSNSVNRNGKITFDGNGTKSDGSLLANGAAVYVENGGEFNAFNTIFTNNQIQTNGGAVYNEGITKIQSGRFTGNIGSAISAAGNSQTTVLDSTFTDNIVETTDGVVYYQGSTGTSSLTIEATEGKTTLFSGNLNPVTNGQANSIYLTANNSGTANVIINTAQNGVVDMHDAMTGGSGNYTANVTKDGDGTWKLAGTNQFQSTGTTTFEIKNGRIELYKADSNNGIAAGEIIIDKGEFKISAGGALNSRGRNLVEATTINLADKAILGFDLTDSVSDDGIAILTMNSNNWNFNGQQTIDILALNENNNFGLFDLLDVSTTLNDADIAKMSLLYHGEDMAKLRQSIGKLKLDDAKNTLQLQILHSQQNGVTQWTDETGNSTWDATSFNWNGISTEIAGSAQFLHGDAVRFTNKGAGTITIIDGGVEIAPQSNYFGMTVDNSETNDYVFTGGSISGSGGLLKQGTGKVIFTQENSFTGGTIIDGGTVIANKVSSLGTGNVTVYNGATVQFDLAGQGGVFNQQISGSGHLIKSGNGSLTLKNKEGEQNSYNGGTTIIGGTLIAEGLDAIGTGDIVTGIGSDFGTLILKLTKDETFAKTVSGTGSLKVEGNGQLTLSVVNNYSGGTTIDADSTIVAKNISAIGTGDVENNGKLIFDLNSGGTLKQTISGRGSLEKNGSGILELEQANTFFGQTTLTAGTLRLSNELALQNSVLNYQGGSLDISKLDNVKLGGLAGTQNFSLSNSNSKPIGLTIGTSNEDSIFGGSITGTGNVTKIGSGTQIFSGRNTYSGGTLISDGRLVSVGIGGFGSGNVINNAEMEFRTDTEESYKNLIVGTGSLWKSGTGTLKLVGENGYTGGTFIEDGQIAVSTVGSLGTGDVSLKSNTSSLYFDIANEEIFSHNIDGIGSVYKAGSGTLVFDKNINSTGKLEVLDGTVFVDANAKTETTVYNGATFGGRGFLDNKITFLNGSTQIVGSKQNAMLTRFTAKNIAYENGSTVYLKVGMNASDQIVAREGFNFAQGGGVVNVVLLNLGLDDFNPELTTSPTEYEIFIAEGGKLQLDGIRIPSIESNSDKLTVEGVNGEVRFLAAPDEGLGVLGYSVKASGEKGRSITVNLAATGPGAIAYLNNNQRAVLRGLNDAEIFDGIYSCNLEYRGAVIDQTMPLIQTAMPFITERSITQFNLATFERLRFLREPLALTDREINAYRGSSHRFAHLHTKSNYLWFQNYGDFMRMNSHGSVPEFQADSYGYTFGMDRGINYHSSVGLGMGGYISDIKANDVYQQADVDSFQFSLYGNWVNDDNWMMTGSVGIVFSSYDLERKVPFFATTLNSRHSGTTSYFSLEGSKKLLFGKYEVSPYLGTDFIWLGENGYTEYASTGLSSLALNIKSQDTFTILTSAGLRLGRSMRLLGGNIVSPSVYAAWIHDWTESDISSTASFFGEPAFKIRGASMNRDRAQVGTNINMTLNKRTDMFARFNAELGDHYSNLSFHWGIRLGY